MGFLSGFSKVRFVDNYGLSRSGFLSGILRSGFSQKIRFYLIRSGTFKWVFKSGICRKLWPKFPCVDLKAF